MVIICPRGTEHRLSLTLLPVHTQTCISELCNGPASLAHLKLCINYICVFLMDNVPLNIVHCLVLLCLDVFPLRARSARFWHLLVYFILLLLLCIWFQVCNPEL